jgi:phosphatidylglycerophosphate synthase
MDGKYENPYDNINLFFAEKASPIFYELGATPNLITTLSMILGFSSIHLYNKEYYCYSGIVFLISYFFDCFDGHYARKYNMVTDLGGYYDHIKDIFVTSSLLFLILSKYKDTDYFIYIISIIFILLITMFLQLGCQEKISNYDSSDDMKNMDLLCWKEPEKILPYSRYFGCGTFNIFLSLLIFSSKNI